MTDEDENGSPALSGAPVDFDRLDEIRVRLGSDPRFSQITERPEFAPERLISVYDHRFYPKRVRDARLEVAWFENGDFSVHYHEDHVDGEFDHRWDRHPSAHNSRDHIHPGPEAPTPGEDTTHPVDWRDVLSMVISEIDGRQRGFWD